MSDTCRLAWIDSPGDDLDSPENKLGELRKKNAVFNITGPFPLVQNLLNEWDSRPQAGRQAHWGSTFRNCVPYELRVNFHVSLEGFLRITSITARFYLLSDQGAKRQDIVLYDLDTGRTGVIQPSRPGLPSFYFLRPGDVDTSELIDLLWEVEQDDTLINFPLPLPDDEPASREYARVGEDK
jgi:hypothetical protein